MKPFSFVLLGAVMTISSAQAGSRFFNPRMGFGSIDEMRASANAPRALQFEAFSVERKVHEGAKQTFMQRAWFSSTFARGKDSPVIYYLCGEWTCSEAGIDRSLGEKARELQAYVVGAEHRFYGRSGPAEGGLAVLTDLTSEQAVEDFAEVERTVIRDRGLTGPWFSYGGSYGGTLAAYYRLTHPELTKGAFVFSGPIILDPRGLTGYERVPVRAFGKPLADKVRAATRYIFDQMTTPSGKEWVRSQFALPNLSFTADDIAAVLVTIIPEFGQGNAIPALASAMKDGQSPSVAATALLGLIRQRFGNEFWGESPLGLAMDPSFTDEMSRWIFQAYREFGWLYVTSPDPDDTVLPGPLTMNYYDEQYGRLFPGVKPVSAQAYPQRMLEALQKTASNMLMINGTIDPWWASALPETVQLPDSVRDLSSVLVQGGAHCAGISGAFVGPTEAAYQAHQAIRERYKVWSGQ